MNRIKHLCASGGGSPTSGKEPIYGTMKYWLTDRPANNEFIFQEGDTHRSNKFTFEHCYGYENEPLAGQPVRLTLNGMGMYMLDDDGNKVKELVVYSVEEDGKGQIYYDIYRGEDARRGSSIIVTFVEDPRIEISMNIYVYPE